MRPFSNISVLALPLACIGLVSGCAEKEAENPGDILRADLSAIEPSTPRHPRAEMFSHAEPRSVRAGCDAQGNLHLTTPPGSRVVEPNDQVFPSEAIVELPQPQRGQPIRVTRSLGFIGDGKLGDNSGPGYGPVYPERTQRSSDADTYGYGRPTTFYQPRPTSFYPRRY